MGEEVEQIDQAPELAQVRRQARRVRFKAMAAAIVLTLIVLVLP